MATQTKTEPIITPVEIIEELPLEKVIDNTLVKNNVTEAVIAALKEKYKELKLASLSDKEGYLEIKETKKEVRKYGILTEKLCKAGREDAIRIQKLWLAKEKEILGKIAEVEAPLEAEIKRFDDEEQRIEDERIKRQEEAYMKRQSELLMLGAVYANGCFNLNDVIYEADLIKESDEDVYQNSILVKYKIQYEKINAAKVEEDRLRAERDAELTRQREELEKQQAILRQQQEEFQRQQAEAARKEQDRVKAEEKEKERIKSELQSNRFALLFPFNKYGEGVDMATLWVLAESDFNEKLEQKKQAFEKYQASQQEAAKVEKERQLQFAIEESARKERERIVEEQRLLELKRQQDEARKAEELAQASDTVKFAELLKQFNSIVLPEMRSGQYRKKVAIIREKLDEIKSL